MNPLFKRKALISFFMFLVAMDPLKADMPPGTFNKDDSLDISRIKRNPSFLNGSLNFNPKSSCRYDLSLFGMRDLKITHSKNVAIAFYPYFLEKNKPESLGKPLAGLGIYLKISFVF